jgi:hypothetical protein
MLIGERAVTTFPESGRVNITVVGIVQQNGNQKTTDYSLVLGVTIKDVSIPVLIKLYEE